MWSLSLGIRILTCVSNFDLKESKSAPDRGRSTKSGRPKEASSKTHNKSSNYRCLCTRRHETEKKRIFSGYNFYLTTLSTFSKNVEKNLYILYRFQETTMKIEKIILV